MKGFYSSAIEFQNNTLGKHEKCDMPAPVRLAGECDKFSMPPILKWVIFHIGLKCALNETMSEKGVDFL